jgi:hypothetical protein
MSRVPPLPSQAPSGGANEYLRLLFYGARDEALEALAPLSSVDDAASATAWAKSFGDCMVRQALFGGCFGPGADGPSRTRLRPKLDLRVLLLRTTLPSWSCLRTRVPALSDMPLLSGRTFLPT